MRSLVTRTFIMSLRRFIAAGILVVFMMTTAVPSYAQSVLSLPAPGVRINLSPEFTPLLLKAVKVHTDNPFKFDFIVDVGDSSLTGDNLKQESTRLIKYFLASLTTPENDFWVNLSPYEKDKVIPESFGTTEMGRDLLAQDYILKQLTASLIYPEEKLGKKFWDKVYAEAKAKYGTTDIPVNTFNKVWVIPEKAIVYENGTTAYVGETSLKVMLEEDYVALSKSQEGKSAGAQKEENCDALVRPCDPAHLSACDAHLSTCAPAHAMASQIIREIIIPALEKEINTGKNFAPLRQVYHSLVLANWYKKRLKDSILAKVYMDKGKVNGVDIDDKAETKMIYDKYVEAFKTGVYNYIKEDYDPVTQETIPRKYFSGGLLLADKNTLVPLEQMPNEAMMSSTPRYELAVNLDMTGEQTDQAMMNMDSVSRIYDHILMSSFSHLTNDLFDDNSLGNALSIHQIVNPDNRPLTAIYGGSGTDVSSALIMLGSTENYFVSRFKDLTVKDLEWVVRALKVLQKEGDNALFKLGNQEQMLSYLDAKHEQGGAHSKDSEFKPYVMMGLVLEFNALRIFDIQIDGDLGAPRIRFQWDHFGLLPKKEYSIMLIDADITDPDNYPSVLKERISRGFDAYLQKRGVDIPKSYKAEGPRNFIRVLHSGMHPGAWFVTDDRYPLAETKLPSGEIKVDYDGDASLDFPLEKNQYSESTELPFDVQQGRFLRLRKVDDQAMLAGENRKSVFNFKELLEKQFTTYTTGRNKFLFILRRIPNGTYGDTYLLNVFDKDNPARKSIAQLGFSLFSADETRISALNLFDNSGFGNERNHRFQDILENEGFGVRDGDWDNYWRSLTSAGFFIEKAYRNNGHYDVWNLDSLLMTIALSISQKQEAKYFLISSSSDRNDYYRNKFGAQSNNKFIPDKYNLRIGLANLKTTSHVKVVGESFLVDDGPDRAMLAGERQERAKLEEEMAQMNDSLMPLARRMEILDEAWKSHSGIKDSVPVSLKTIAIEKFDKRMLRRFVLGDIEGGFIIAFKKFGISQEDEILLWKWFHEIQKTFSNQSQYLVERLDFIENVIAEKRGKKIRVLDLGSGPQGRALGELKNSRVGEKLEAIGIDMDVTATNSNDDVNLVQGDIRHMPFENDSIDIVNDHSTMKYFEYNLSEFIGAIKEVMRVLTKDGWFIYSQDGLLHGRMDKDLMKIILNNLGYKVDIKEDEPFIIYVHKLGEVPNNDSDDAAIKRIELELSEYSTQREITRQIEAIESALETLRDTNKLTVKDSIKLLNRAVEEEKKVDSPKITIEDGVQLSLSNLSIRYWILLKNGDVNEADLTLKPEFKRRVSGKIRLLNNSSVNAKGKAGKESANEAMIAVPNDNAQLSDTKGGIDFNVDQMNLQIQNNGREIKFNLDPAMLEQLQNAPGFTPVIINIQPMVDLHLFLGLADNQNIPQTASL